MPGPDEHTLEPEHWLEKHGDYLFSYAMLRLNHTEKAEDLIQETFLSALASRDSFRGNSTERTWLISILKRKIIDHYRKKYRQDPSHDEDFGSRITDPVFFRQQDPYRGHWKDGEGPNSHSLLPEGGLEQEELASVIRICIELLPPQLATVFIMKMIDGEDADLICKEMGITPSNLWVMLHRSRLKMRKCLEKKWLETKE